MGSASFSSNDSSLSPCGNPDAPTSTSDVQTAARRRSKSLPELDSAADGEGSAGQERPASAEGVVKESNKKSHKKMDAAGGDDAETSHVVGSERQSGMVETGATPDMRGTIPLSHAPSSIPRKSSMSSTPFAVPRMNYGSMHSHTGAYGAMYPGYQSYNMIASMPTQSSYPPTYNPYSGNGSSAYIGSSGPPGSVLYHQNNRPSPPSYGTHQNMLNYMSSYPSNLPSDGRQASAMPGYSSLYNSAPPLSALNAGGTYTSSDSSAMTPDLAQISLSSATTDGCKSTLAPATSQSHIPSSSDVTSINPDLMPSGNSNNGKSASNSPRNLSNSVSPRVPGENGCDSTTHLNAMEPGEERESVVPKDRTQEDPKIQFYTTRYVL